jgi:hypothetical protein
MRLFLFASFMWAMSFPVLCQTSPDKYEVGTITAVTREENASGNSDQVRYDVSIQVRNKAYVVSYTPPYGANSVEYAPGLHFMVMVGKDTLKISNKLSGTAEAPILRTETLEPGPTLDWSKAPSRYFSMMMQDLSESLALTEEQKTKLKPIVQQETGEASQVIFTSVIPREERLVRWEKIVRSSDSQIRSFLSPLQWEKLQETRKQQKQELKKFVAQKEARN